MKRYIMILAVMAFSIFSLSAQIMVNGKTIKTENVHYLQVEFFTVIGSNEVKAYIDYGQRTALIERKKRLLSNRNGKAMVFNSTTDGLNWFFDQGYEVLEIYNPRTGGNTVNNDLIFLLREIKQ